MKAYRIEHEGKQQHFASQEPALKAARLLALESYDPVEVEMLESKTWPFTKQAWVDILNGEPWCGDGKVIYTAKAGKTGERPEAPAEEMLAETPDVPIEPITVKQTCGEPLHAESVVVIDPARVGA
jgi:hypothetical protein